MITASMNPSRCDRYAPQIPFPAYAFVPGKHPHPNTDPQGHSFGQCHPVPEPLDPQHPECSLAFLTAIDLFNAGFYWEAHEAWEGLWIAADRIGQLADFLKGLIKLAAAGVKIREGQIRGVERHARRAVELFQSVRERSSDPQYPFCGMSLDQLVVHAHSLAERPLIDETPSTSGRIVVPFCLSLILAKPVQC
jgi:hypothetical protein